MFCPKCLSDQVAFERSSGYSGYRCLCCHEWSYTNHMLDYVGKAEREIIQLGTREQLLAAIDQYFDTESLAKALTRYLPISIQTSIISALKRGRNQNTETNDPGLDLSHEAWDGIDVEDCEGR